MNGYGICRERIKDDKCEVLNHEKYNVGEQIRKHADDGGENLACRTCIKSRHMENSMEGCPISTMVDCVNVVVWADGMVTF